jgi:uncharacterized membrane protein
MALLVLGILLWAAAHFFQRLAPEMRPSMGARGKGLVALVLVASVVLMVIGYKGADTYDQWAVPAPFRHINNLLVLIALWMMSPAGQKGRLLQGVRHPMLAGFKLWALAHLLVNNELASIVLFGGLLAWAVAEVIVINRAAPGWQPRRDGSLAKDAMFFAASILLMGVIGYVHGLVGPTPFGG